MDIKTLVANITEAVIEGCEIEYHNYGNKTIKERIEEYIGEEACIPDSLDHNNDFFIAIIPRRAEGSAFVVCREIERLLRVNGALE